MAYATLLSLVSFALAPPISDGGPGLAPTALSQPANPPTGSARVGKPRGRGQRLAGTILSAVGAGLGIGGGALWTRNEFQLDTYPDGGPHGVGLLLENLTWLLFAVGNASAVVGNGLYMRGTAVTAVPDTDQPFDSPLYWLAAGLAASALASTPWATSKPAAKNGARWLPLGLTVSSQLVFLVARSMSAQD